MLCKCPAMNRAVTFCILTLTLLGLVARALVPTGFMPVQDSAGTAMVICSGVEQKTIYLGEDGQPVKAPSHKAEAPCVFAFAPLAVKPYMPALVPVTLATYTVAYIIPEALPDTVSVPHLYPARAPPTFIS